MYQWLLAVAFAWSGRYVMWIGKYTQPQFVLMPGWLWGEDWEGEA